MASENNKLERFKHHWKNMPVHQQFETAVGIIKNLPKDGKLVFLYITQNLKIHMYFDIQVLK